MVEKLLQFVVAVFGTVAALMIISIGVCIFILVFSMTLDCVTGFDLIREVIRPFFEHLRG